MTKNRKERNVSSKLDKSRKKLLVLPQTPINSEHLIRFTLVHIEREGLCRFIRGWL